MLKAPPFIGTTVAEAKQYIRDNAEKGTRCPCCKRINKIYRYNIVGTMAYALAWACRHSDPAVREGWIDMPETGRRAEQRFRNYPKLQYWGLIERKRTKKEGEVHSGLWRPTANGRAFIAGKLRVPQYAYVFNGVILRHSVETLVGAEDCREHFDLSQV